MGSKGAPETGRDFEEEGLFKKIYKKLKPSPKLVESGRKTQGKEYQLDRDRT
jgi:hypothetical protein